MRGITILLVVMNHVRLKNASTQECYDFIFTINEVFAPLRMPTFVMVSGALLYYTRIRKGWSIRELYRDKMIRIGLPLIFCTILGNIAQIAFSSFVKTPHPVTPLSFLQSFVLYEGYPWPHRWYLMALLTMMLLYPLYLALRDKWASLVVVLLLLALSKVDFQVEGVANWCYIFQLNRSLPFFFLGITVFRFGWWRWLAHGTVSFALAALYIIFYVLKAGGEPLSAVEDCFPVYELLGVSMLVSLCIQIDKYYPGCCRWFRAYIFQIYLFGIAFQAFVELILWRYAGCPHQWVTVFYVLNVLAGIFAPVALSKLVERIPCNMLKLCIGLSPKKLVTHKDSISTSEKP